MRILVSGGRSYSDRDAVWQALDFWFNGREDEPVTVVHGGANGADRLASGWVRKRRSEGLDNVSEEVHRAQWGKHGRKAGPIRNSEMVAAGADLMLSFPGGAGTFDCTSKAARAGIRVFCVEG